jgi:acetylornithine aminotransferase
MSSTLMATYKRLPVAFVRGEGAWLWDSAGKRYLDAIAGIAVCGLGHAHPNITSALCEQAGTLIHTSNLYSIPLQESLGRELTRISQMDRVFFANSGAEANEAAIKLARLHGKRQGFAIPKIVVMEGSFHGRTLATLTATGNRKIQAGFEPLLQGFVRVPYGDLAVLETLAQQTNEIAAVLVEPIQGEGGVNIPPVGYLKAIKAICTANNWLLILDEIQTGLGRTGRWFAHQHADILPDVMTLAKSLGNGVPIGACLARGESAELFGPGTHGSTFGGNPLACRAALAVLEVMERDSLVTRSASLGAKLLNGFRGSLLGHPGVLDVRGMGLMIGIELSSPCVELVNQALEIGLLINVTAERVIRLLPPLVLKDAQADQLLDTLSDLIKRFLA